MKARPLLLAVILGALGLALPATASAWRRPHPGERRAITRVAQGSHHAGPHKVYVSKIRISTVRPWASAVVTVYIDHEPDRAMDVLHRVRGRWRLTKHSPGTADVQCGIGMPRADQRNLGFPACSPL